MVGAKVCGQRGLLFEKQGLNRLTVVELEISVPSAKRGKRVKFSLQKVAVCLSAACLFASTDKSGAFALLGPVQPWMQVTNGVIGPGDIGGPMDISNEYRWNVPVVTYGFDQSFMDYFGTNGVAAVEGAIQILNNLPPASSIVLTNYPFDSQRINYLAQAQGLLDLKSETLTFLLEQLGLAQATRSIFVLRKWSPRFISPFPNGFTTESDWVDWAYPDYISQLNFDPVTLALSHNVNGTLYTAYMVIQPNLQFFVPYPVDFFADEYDTVADIDTLFNGGCFTGLTYDDVGGLAYLLSPKNINYETLPPGVRGVGRNKGSFVHGAWRPGVDKITFVPQPVNPSNETFQTYVSRFTDHYIIKGVLKTQELVRTISKPDILFSVADIVVSNYPGESRFDRTGTTNWINNAAANGNPNGAGPGVIQPPVQIVFGKIGTTFITINGTETEASDYPQFWGSFDGSTNVPVIYPISKNGTNQFTIRMGFTWGLYASWSNNSFVWNRNSALGVQYTMQTSTNLVDWINLFTVTNNGTIFFFGVENPASSSRFYRLIP